MQIHNRAILTFVKSILDGYRLLTLVCLETLGKMTIIVHMEGKSLSNGQHLRLFIIASIQWHLMCGVMDAYCMRFGPSERSHSMTEAMQRLVEMLRTRIDWL